MDLDGAIYTGYTDENGILILDLPEAAIGQEIDVEGKYAVVCDAHGTTSGATSVPKARLAMKDPALFCDGCRELDERGISRS